MLSISILSLASWSLSLNSLVATLPPESSLPIVPYTLENTQPTDTLPPSTLDFTLAQGNTDPGSAEERNTEEEQLFVPLHRKQPGRTPFVPTDLPLLPDSQDTSSDSPSSPTSDSPSNYVGAPASSIGVPGGSGATWRT